MFYTLSRLTKSIQGVLNQWFPALGMWPLAVCALLVNGPRGDQNWAVTVGHQRKPYCSSQQTERETKTESELWPLSVAYSDHSTMTNNLWICTHVSLEWWGYFYFWYLNILGFHFHTCLPLSCMHTPSPSENGNWYNNPWKCSFLLTVKLKGLCT